MVLIKKIIHIRLCTPKDLKSILSCQQCVIESLSHPNYYFPSTSTELEDLLLCEKSRGFILGAYIDNLLYGFVSIKKWVGKYYGYNYNPNKICYSIEDTLVMEEYRGFGTQSLLWKEVISQLPKSSILLCTIHPQNEVSLSNAINLGFEKCMLCYPYDISPRIILKKEI